MVHFHVDCITVGQLHVPISSVFCDLRRFSLEILQQGRIHQQRNLTFLLEKMLHPIFRREER